MKKLLAGITALLLLFLVYKIGPIYPRPNINEADPYYTASTFDINTIQDEVELSEAKDNIKPHCKSYIQWADSINTQTEYALVYIHGFGACPWEGSPVFNQVADSLQMNLYAHRVKEHGLITDSAFTNFKSVPVLEDIANAFAIGKTLGKKVILMSMSTGSTYSLWLASHRSQEIAGQLLFSPNIRVADPKANLLVGPWGTALAKQVLKGEYRTWEPPEEAKPYFYAKQHISGSQELVALLEETMQPQLFKKVTTPTFMGYYYKSDSLKDNVIDIEKAQWMFEHLGTPSNLKKSKAYASADDHNMLNPVFSKKSPVIVRNDAIQFIQEVIFKNK